MYLGYPDKVKVTGTKCLGGNKVYLLSTFNFLYRENIVHFKI